MKQHWFLAILGTGFAGLLGAILSSDRIEDAFIRAPLFMGAWTLSVLLMGAGVGGLVQSALQKRAQKQQAEKEVDPEALAAFKKICATCYLDESQNMIEPMIFTLDEADLTPVDLDEEGIRTAEESGLVRLELPNEIKAVHQVKEDKMPGVVFTEEESDEDRNMGRARFTFGKENHSVQPVKIPDETTDAWCVELPSLDFGVVRFTVKGKRLAKGFNVKQSKNLFKCIDDRYAKLREE